MTTTTTVYKLTDEHGQTHNGTSWGEGLEHSGTGKGELCGPGWIHVYDDPLIAVFLNPLHANFENPRLWRAEAWGKHRDDHGLKSGWRHVRTVEELPVPECSTEQRVRFAILCALAVTTDEAWVSWARGWLDGADRSSQAAEKAATAKTEKARAAWMAARAAWVAGIAAAEAAWAVAWVAWAAAAVVVEAAEAAAEAAAPLDLPALARQAISA